MRDYVSGSASPDEEGFSLDGDGAFIDPGAGSGLSAQCGADHCSYGYPPPQDPGWGWGWDWWGWGWGDGGGGSSSSGSGGGSNPPPEVVCGRGSGKVQMTFDGRTIRVTAQYAPNSAHAASVAAYVAGIESTWTKDFPEAGIGMEVDLVPDPNGFVFSFATQYVHHAGLQFKGGELWEMQLGSLDGIVESERSYFMRVAVHEFGHFWFGANLPDSADLPLSIMANPRHGQVLPSDLVSMVEACRTGGVCGMKRLLLISLLYVFSVSCATTRQITRAWCDERIVRNASFGQEIHSVKAFPIRVDQLQRAYDLLARQPFVGIDRRVFNDMTSGIDFVESSHYYLIRSGIYAGYHAGPIDIRAASDRPGTRAFQFRETDRLLTVFSYQGVRRERLFNMPILIEIPYSVRSTQAYCRTHY